MQYAKVITSCRSCGSKNLLPILSLGEHYVSSFVDSSQEYIPKVPLELVLCNVVNGGCGLLQLRHTTSVELLYKQYWYRSATNEAMVDALRDITSKAEYLIKLSRGDIVIDIGCNDGTLLRSYKTKDIKLVGFEPANDLIQYAKTGNTQIINDFFNYEAFRRNFGDNKAKIITSIAMFYDLDDPNTFVSDVVKSLDEDGIWIIQMSYLPSMLKQNAFDNICHEHLEYYSLTSLQWLLQRHSLELFDTELNDINGGSFRLYIKHEGCDSIIPFKGAGDRIRDLELYERKLRLDDKDVYNAFTSRVNAIKNQLYNFITEENIKGKTVYAYGASTKGNTLLQFCNLNCKLIKAAAERNADKVGKRTIGTLIPIISEEQARQERPDYFLILPWHFLDGFKRREERYLKAGGKFIVPLPEFKIIEV